MTRMQERLSIGMSMDTTREEMTLAVLEGVRLGFGIPLRWPAASA